MDLERVKQLRLKLSLHLIVIACLTAMLVASGSGTLFLPVFILFVSITSYIVVDHFEWFELKMIGSAIGMVIATSVAISLYVASVYGQSETGQLLAVAGLLVFPEAVLFWQRKTLRVFEQLAIFLLLEMVVAALVNDNILFGLLLAPIMLLWVSALFLFSRYTTLVRIDPSIEKPLPQVAEILFKRFVRTVLGSKSKRRLVRSSFVPSSESQRSVPMRRALQSIPIGVGALAFAGLFFYLLPRVGTGSMGSPIKPSTAIGLPDRLTFGNIGNILQDPTSVMRVTLEDPLTNAPFRPETPPYLRARVFDYYGRIGGRRLREWGNRRGLTPQLLGSRTTSAPDSFTRQFGTNSTDELSELLDNGRRSVRALFDLRPGFTSELFAVPPLFRSSRSQKIELSYDAQRMVFQRLDSAVVQAHRTTSYEFVSGAFRDREQCRVTPAKLTNRPEHYDRAVRLNYRELVDGFRGFPQADIYRAGVLNRANIQPDQKIQVALELERHFAVSGAFSYTLDLGPPADSDLDPIEDFIINQRKGHCQYFASAMVCMLRQSQIPSRIVIGYRPTEFNQLGKYFNVRQQDAHAWVEALFTHEELENSIFRNEISEAEHYWVRFDPTPPADGDGGITEQDGQAMDFAEKLWQEYVVDGQKLTGENSIYAPVADSDNPYESLVAQVTELRDRIVEFFSFRSGLGFAWPVATIIIIAGTLIVGLWQLLRFLPRFAPRWATRLGLARSEMEMQHPFFAKCIKTLNRLGIRRGQGTTPKEFVERAESMLESSGHSANQSLDFLTSLYYRLRFGKLQTPSAEEQRAITSNLQAVEKAVSSARKA